MTTLKSATLAPIPSARPTTATSVNAGRPGQLTKGVPDVSSSRFEGGQAPSIAIRVRHRQDATHVRRRAVAGSVGRHARSLVLGGEQRAMRFQFLADLGVGASGAKQRGHTEHQRAHPSHRVAFGAMNRATISVASCQARVSRSTCLRPALVKR